MLARQIDWQWVNNFDQYDIYVEHDQIQTVIRNTANHQSLWVNKRNPPFDNVRVREAIWALDRVAAVEKLARGHGTVRFLMLPGSRWDLDELFACGVDGWCSNPQGPDLNRETAGKILQGEGFPFDQTFTLTVGAGTQDQKVAEFVQDQLRVMGITIELDTLGSDELQERIIPAATICRVFPILVKKRSTWAPPGRISLAR